MTFDNTNKGTIGRNERKTLDTHPDLSGSINVDGKDFWLSGWKKTSSKDGSTFYSLSVKPKEARQSAPRQGNAPPTDFSDLKQGKPDDDLPW